MEQTLYGKGSGKGYLAESRCSSTACTCGGTWPLYEDDTPDDTREALHIYIMDPIGRIKPERATTGAADNAFALADPPPPL